MSAATLELRVPARRLALAGPLALLVLALALPWPGEPVRAAVRTAVAPRGVADSATVRTQAAAAATAVYVSHARSAATLDRVRELRLSIPAEEADRLRARAAADLAAVRQSALALLAALTEVSAADLEALARAASARPDVPATVLAPSLSNVVRETERAFQQITDRGVKELTAPR